MTQTQTMVVVTLLTTQAALTLTLGGLLCALRRTSPQPHLGSWGRAWLAQGVSLGASALDTALLFDHPFEGVGLLVGLTSQAGLCLQALWLWQGARALRSPGARAPALAVTLTLAFGLGALGMLPGLVLGEGPWTVLVAPVGLPALVSGVGFLSSVWSMTRTPTAPGSQALARLARLVRVGLAGYGLVQLGHALHVVGTAAGWWSLGSVTALRVVDLLLETLLGMALVGWALEAERDRADERVEAARRAEGALRIQENRSRRLIENVSDVIAIVDSAGVVRYASPSVKRVLGFEPSRYVGMRDEDLVHPDDLPATQAAFAEAFEQPERVHRVVSRYRHRDGSFRALESALNRLPLGEGPVELVVTSRDISEHRQLEQKLAEIHRLDGLGHLAGGVAHDFNNLLTVIVGAVSGAKAELAPGHPVSQELDEIAQASTRAAALTRQLLAFARQQRIEQPRMLDLNLLVKGLSRMLHRLIGENVELVGPRRTQPALVRADPGQLEQVIVNLVVNARDAMPDGGRLVLELAERRLDVPELPPGDYVDLTVSDTGMGIAQHVRPHLFEPFFTTKERGKGTGLGLATSYGIVRQHGGHLFFEDATRGGTCFHVLLPLTAGLEDSVRERPPDARRGQGETILLVEDDAPVRATAARILRGHGYEVLEAANGEEALPLALGPRCPDLVLTDLVMPRLGGVDLALQLKVARPELRVSFTSGYSERQDLERVKPEDLLAKPFDPSELLHFVRQKLAAHPGL